MNTDNATVNPSDFFASIGGDDTPPAETKNPEVIVEETPPAGDHVTPPDAEVPNIADPETDPEKAPELDPEKEEKVDEEELPESASKEQRQAFARLRKQLQDTKKQLVEKQSAVTLSDEDKSGLEFYKSNKDRIDSSFKVVEAVSQWESNPDQAVEQIKVSFPEVYKRLTAQETAKSEAPSVEPQGSPEAILEDLGLNMEELEEESVPVAQAFKKLSGTIVSLEKRLAAKEKELMAEISSTKEEVNKTRAEKEADAKKSREDKIRQVEVTWYDSIRNSVKEYGLSDQAVDRIYTLAVSDVNSDIQSGKYKDLNIDNYATKIDINSYVSNVLDTLNVKKPAVEAPKEKEAQPGIRTNISRTTAPTRPKVDIKTSEDFLNSIAGRK